MTKSEKIAEKIKQLQAQKQMVDAREKEAERKARTRELIQLGALLVADEKQGTLVAQYRAVIKAEAEKKAKEKVDKPSALDRMLAKQEKANLAKQS